MAFREGAEGGRGTEEVLRTGTGGGRLIFRERLEGRGDEESALRRRRESGVSLILVEFY